MKDYKLIEIKNNDSFDIDSLYIELNILKKILDFENLKLFLEKNTLDMEKSLKGYLYFIETSLCRIVAHQESLVRDERIYQLLHYKMYNIKEIKSGIKNNPEIGFMEDILNMRNNLAKIRLGDKVFSENILQEVSGKLDSLSDYYLKNNVKGKVEENSFLLVEKSILYITNNHLDFSDSTDFNPKTGEATFSLVAPYNIHCVDLDDSENISYSFNSPDIKNHEGEYFDGYSSTLSFLLSSLNLSKKYLDSINSAKEWEDLRMLGNKISRGEYKDNSISLYDYPLYMPHTTLIFSPISKKNIDSLSDFKMILKDRDVQILSYNSEEQKMSLFLSLFHGRMKLDDKVQIIRFKAEKKKEKGWYATSYLFYIPFGGLGFYNDSHWLFFYNMGLENDDGYNCKFISLFEKIIKDHEDNLELESYNITDKTLLRGIKNNYNRRRFRREGDNIHYIFNEGEMLKLKESKALLRELLANYLFRDEAIYSKVGDLLKKENGEHSTDMDCLVITKDKVCIFQVTSFIENRKKTYELKEHFEKIESRLKFLPDLKKYNINEKAIVRNIFCFDVDISPETTKYLKSNNIEIIKYDDMKDSLGKEMRIKISRILDLNELN